MPSDKIVRYSFYMRIGIFLFVFFGRIPSCTLWAQLKNQPSDQGKPDDTKPPRPQNVQRGTKDSPLVVDVLGHPRSNVDAAKAESDDKSKEFNDRLVAWSAVAAAVFTGLLVIIGWRGVNAALRTLDEMRAAGKQAAQHLGLTERPWVAPSLRLISPLRIDGKGVAITVSIELTNVGKSPAIGIDVRAHISLLGIGSVDEWKSRSVPARS